MVGLPVIIRIICHAALDAQRLGGKWVFGRNSSVRNKHGAMRRLAALTFAGWLAAGGSVEKL